MANTQNLRPPRTSAEARERGRKGGIKSGQVRRQYASFRECFSENMDDATRQSLYKMLLKRANMGNLKAFEILRDTLGEVPGKESVNPSHDSQVKDIYDIILPELCDIYDDTDHVHKILTSGRAGTKSSFAGIVAIHTIVSDEPAAVVAIRKRHNKLRKTIYKEIIRAITRCGYDKNDFEIGVAPMQITYKANGNTIYFSGSDSIDDTKGIIDEDRPIKLVIIDELTEFFEQGEGEDELSNIEATFVRGNDEEFTMLYLYNPPKNPNATINQWKNKMLLRDDTICRHVDYRDVPVKWIGKKLIETAESLKKIDYKMYRWLWLGESIGIDDLIYYMFDEEKHVSASCDGAYKLIGVGVDYGQQNATTYQAAAVDVNKRKLVGLDEFYHSGRDSGQQMSPSEYANALVDFCRGLHEKYDCNAFYVFIDPSAKGLSEEIKRLSYVEHQFAISVKDAENSVKLGIGRCQKLLTYSLCTVSPSQTNLIKEFGMYEYDKVSIEKGDEKPSKVNDHCMDAWRYLVMGLWSKIKYFLPRSEQE